MKKILALSLMAASATALAVESTATFGILRVDVAANQQVVVISAPWVDAEATDVGAATSVKVKDLVTTTNLTDGDQLFVYDTTTGDFIKAFQLKSGAWVGAKIVGDKGEIPAGDENTAITRGQAISLRFKTAPTEAKSIYLYGQYKAVTDESQALPGNENGVYHLVAAPKTEDLCLNSVGLNNDYVVGPVWKNVSDDDVIIYNAGNGSYKKFYWHVPTGSTDSTKRWCAMEVQQSANSVFNRVAVDPQVEVTAGEVFQAGDKSYTLTADKFENWKSADTVADGVYCLTVNEGKVVLAQYRSATKSETVYSDGNPNKTLPSDYAIKIPAGQGFWYVSHRQDTSVQWKGTSAAGNN